MKNTLCASCGAKIPTLSTRLNKVNTALHRLGVSLYESLPCSEVDNILTEHGFNPTDTWHDISETGRLHQEVGEGKWISVSWYKYASGRYEVIAYVN